MSARPGPDVLAALTYALALMRGRPDVEAPFNAAIIQGHIYALIEWAAAAPLPPAPDLREAPRGLVEQWRKRTATYQLRADTHSDPYGDTAHEWRVRSMEVRECADELSALLDPPGGQKL